jgi:hypothetical protein
VVVLLLSCFLPYPHHPHRPLDHCSPLGLDRGIYFHLHVHLDQALMRVEWYPLGNDFAVAHLDLVALYHQWSFFIRHHMKLLHHLQDQDKLAPLESH